MGQGPEGRKEHFVGDKLRGQNSLQDKSIDQGVNQADQVIRRHGYFVLNSQLAEPFSAKIITST